mmetsp:Transcript_114189/g.355592  ORF Transcript_114189/g.355592 Transcript_114189/m.355592 type:complete len:386 (+) Transcript_114189:288-1445(+)
MKEKVQLRTRRQVWPKDTTCFMSDSEVVLPCISMRMPTTKPFTPWMRVWPMQTKAMPPADLGIKYSRFAAVSSAKPSTSGQGFGTSHLHSSCKRSSTISSSRNPPRNSPPAIRKPNLRGSMPYSSSKYRADREDDGNCSGLDSEAKAEDILNPRHTSPRTLRLLTAGGAERLVGGPGRRAPRQIPAVGNGGEQAQQGAGRAEVGHAVDPALVVQHAADAEAEGRAHVDHRVLRPVPAALDVAVHVGIGLLEPSGQARQDLRETSNGKPDAELIPAQRPGCIRQVGRIPGHAEGVRRDAPREVGQAPLQPVADGARELVAGDQSADLNRMEAKAEGLDGVGDEGQACGARIEEGHEHHKQPPLCIGMTPPHGCKHHVALPTPLRQS